MKTTLSMKTIYNAAAMALCAMMMLAACGNAGAQNENKKEKKAPETKEKAVKELNTEQFKAKVFDITSENMVYLGDKPAIVDFNATWCGPCQRIAPILEELAVEYGDKIVIYKVDVDKNKELAKAFNVSSIPAVLYIPAANKEPVMTIGSRNKDKFKEEIETILF